MLDLLLVALFQAAAGTPAPPPTAEAPPAQASAEQAQEDSQQRRCRSRRVTGTRLSSLVTCRRGNGEQSQETRDAMHDLQRPSGASAS